MAPRYGASSSSETTNYETSQLRQEFNDLKRSISAASSPGFKARPSRGGEDLPPILRMFGKAPRNLPSTVKRNPKPNEGKWGNGKDQYYDGRTDAKHLGGSTGVDTAGIVRTPFLRPFALVLSALLTYCANTHRARVFGISCSRHSTCAVWSTLAVAAEFRQSGSLNTALTCA